MAPTIRTSRTGSAATAGALARRENVAAMAVHSAVVDQQETHRTEWSRRTCDDRLDARVARGTFWPVRPGQAAHTGERVIALGVPLGVYQDRHGWARCANATPSCRRADP